MHWSAGEDENQVDDKAHYHFIVTRWGDIVKGNFTPEDNLNTKDGTYAAHTFMMNTGSIGVAMDAMKGAVERPFYAGPEPITDVQVEAFCKFIAGLLKKYGIPLSGKTCLTHAEVQPVLSVKQKGKWDITWLPGMTKPGDPVSVGNILRYKIKGYM